MAAAQIPAQQYSEKKKRNLEKLKWYSNLNNRPNRRVKERMRNERKGKMYPEMEEGEEGSGEYLMGSDGAY